uniref:Uncharacterized protein n=2 Tax=Ciona intestinalis TaxID=7719 RepID=H2XQH6_CIOIN
TTLCINAETKTEEILSWNDSKKNVTGSNNFHISPNKNPIYMFGCLHIKVSSKTGDFDFGLSS